MDSHEIHKLITRICNIVHHCHVDSYIYNYVSLFYRLFTLLLWLPPCVLDRIQNYVDDRVCIWDPSLNKEMVIVIGVLGHHGSFLVLFGCYLRVLFVVRRQRRIATIGNSTSVPASTISQRQQPRSQVTTCVVSETDNIPSVSGACENDNNYLQIPILDKDESTLNTSHSGHSDKERKERLNQSKQTSKGPKANKDARVFVTLTYIIVGYIVCWVPFHIVYDVTAVRPDLVSDITYTIAFWLTYLNSTLNPFLYNFSSSEFRSAFKDILKRKHL